MKKSLKPALIFSLLLFTVTALMVLAYVGIKLECEVLVKDKVTAQYRLETGLNTRIDFTARYQLLESEERITAIALQELAMIRDSMSSSRIIISSAEVSRINDLLGVQND